MKKLICFAVGHVAPTGDELDAAIWAGHFTCARCRQRHTFAVFGMDVLVAVIKKRSEMLA